MRTRTGSFRNLRTKLQRSEDATEGGGCHCAGENGGLIDICKRSFQLLSVRGLEQGQAWKQKTRKKGDGGTIKGGKKKSDSWLFGSSHLLPGGASHKRADQERNKHGKESQGSGWGEHSNNRNTNPGQETAHCFFYKLGCKCPNGSENKYHTHMQIDLYIYIYSYIYMNDSGISNNTKVGTAEEAS